MDSFALLTEFDKQIDNIIAGALRVWLPNDGTIAEPLGKVELDLSVEQAVDAARATALAIIATLKNELGSLDEIKQWNRLFGMVNSAAGFNQQTPVINGASALIVDVFWSAIGRHTRSAVGMAELAFNIPVEIEAELSLR